MEIITQNSYEEPDKRRIKELRSEALVIHRRERKASGLAVFVHGFGGSRYGTWGNFPKLLFENFPALDVGLYEHRTQLRRLTFWRSIPLEREARTLGDLLPGLVEYEFFVLLGHSMGGLLSKGAIAYLAVVNRDVAERIHGLFLLATPQLGAVPRWLSFLSKDARALSVHGSYVTEISEAFANHIYTGLGIPIDEKIHIPAWALLASEDRWVTVLSAGVSLDGKQKSNVRSSHTEIVKPAGQDADSYRFVRSCIEKAVFGHQQPLLDDEASCATLVDLARIRELAQHTFGDQVSSLPLMHKWWHANEEVFWTIVRVISNSEFRNARIVGYFCVIPLKKEAISRICSGEITGATLSESFIQARGQRPDAVYIGAVVGTDRRSKASVIYHLKAYMKRASDEYRIPVLARPITRDGLRIAKHLGMVSVDASRATIGNVFVRGLLSN